MTAPASGPSVFSVPSELDGARLDVVLARLVPSLSRTRLQELVRDGRVELAGEHVRRPGTRVVSGQGLSIEMQGEAAAATERVPVAPLVVLFEDEHLAAIDKPAGVITHPTEKYRGGTISDLAVEHFGDLPTVHGEDRPGIVHRLDRLTSGVLLIGKTRAALEGLKTAFKERRVTKTYLAIVYGSPRFDSDWIETWIRPPARPGDRLRTAPEGEGRDAQTYYEVIERFDRSACVRCRPKTGRTHQIRVHMSSIGHALVGDPLYRPRHTSLVLPSAAPSLRRQALHAAAIAFDHPVTGERIEVEAPLPADMRGLLEWLREHRPATSG